jgi:hypothetical protein
MSKFTPPGLQRLAPGIGLTLMAATVLLACGPATPEPIDPDHLIGRWELQADDRTEWIQLKKDGRLSADIRSNGFLATTIPAAPEAELQGAWELDGDTLEIRIDGAEVPLIYQIASLTDRTMTTVRSDGIRHVLQKGL